jgi:D-alanyl-D-alanine carboxypeptidase
MTRTDAHGGWMASATDLARFLIRIEGFANKPDILLSSTITTMTTRAAGSIMLVDGLSTIMDCGIQVGFPELLH